MGSGLGLSFACTDTQGCTGVNGGESRTFAVTMTGLAAGIYDFNAFAQGVDALAHNRVTVTAVPEPGSLALMLVGVTAIGSRLLRGRRAAPQQRSHVPDGV